MRVSSLPKADTWKRTCRDANPRPIGSHRTSVTTVCLLYSVHARWSTCRVSCRTQALHVRCIQQGRSDRGYIGIYPPKSVYLTNFYVVTGFFFSLTQDKFDIVLVCALARVSFTYLHRYTPQFIPLQMKFLATPLVYKWKFHSFMKKISVNKNHDLWIKNFDCYALRVMDLAYRPLYVAPY